MWLAAEGHLDLDAWTRVMAQCGKNHEQVTQRFSRINASNNHPP